MIRLAASWLAVSASVALAAAPAPRKPNVVLFVVDDMGYADCGLTGCKDIPTPNIDAIAKAGVRFTGGYTSGCVCSPTRAGLITGRYQQRFAFLNNDGGIPADVPLLPGVLRGAGYRTALMGKWHSAGPMPPERGCFDETLTAPKSGPWVDYFNPALARNGKPEKRSGYISEILAQEAESVIERNRDRPFSLTVTFNAPHIGPIKMPHEKIRLAYDAAKAEGKVYDAPKTPTARPGEAARYAGQFPGDTARADTAATIAALDEAVGRILDKLQKAGVADNTAVFFFADNGGHPENRSENGALRDYKWSHYEGGIRVPFLAACPGVFPAGLIYDKPVSTLDIFPTVLALTGAIPPDGLDGVNLVPYLKGERAGDPHESLFFLTGDKGAVVQGRWKLLVFPHAAGQLYDLAKDLSETNDLAAAEAPRVQAMTAQWRAWKSQMPPPERSQNNIK